MNEHEWPYLGPIFSQIDRKIRTELDHWRERAENAEANLKPGSVKGYAFEHVDCGFKWGDARVIRHDADHIKGYITLLITTRKYKKGLQLRIDKNGDVMVKAPRRKWRKLQT